MTFEQYQQRAMSTALYPGIGSNLAYPALGLNGEAGEVAEIIKKVYRDSDGVLKTDGRKALQKELGDVLWYLAALCHEAGLDLDEVARLNLDKLSDRSARGVLHGSGDDR